MLLYIIVIYNLSVAVCSKLCWNNTASHSLYAWLFTRTHSHYVLNEKNHFFFFYIVSIRSTKFDGQEDLLNQTKTR